MKNEHFNGVMSKTERNAWQAFKSVVNNFLGNKKSSEYALIVQGLMQSLKSSWSTYVSKDALSKIASELIS